MARFYDNDVTEILYTEEEIRQRVKELGAQITKDYAGKDLVVVCVLKGAYIFAADLFRQIDLPATVDFMIVSSYGSSTKSSGVVKIVKDLSRDIKDKHILIAEDILDTGLTLNYLIEMLKQRNPASVEICAMCRKPICKCLTPKYVGYEVPDAFLVGYGLDYDEKYRNMPEIGILKPEVYAK